MKTTQKIIQIIKRNGEVTARELAEQFDMTTMGARQHLQTLQDDGILDFHDIKVKVGRPTRHWCLTEKGHQQFSDRHGELTIQIMSAVEELFGCEGMEKVAAERESNTLISYQATLENCHSLEEKLHALTQLRRDEGYMAELQANANGYLFIENHCPICKAATHCPSLCQSELSVFQQLLATYANVAREEHIILGQRRCTYRITPL
ncbi:transcriptional regulator [Vibrio sp. 10N.286.49.B3]|uniref:helix-turn-helix transcriptional regulator n=1 Tax=Vibrio sp. 10N.286.49.B3 TaxID=1880855 RepID=UPI000C83F788|nr:metalloregulator ArsR/SmtB family transcription factor [Vibrio sp. 10N.286.49.B3]PMH46254.1 transcriptional regulator [Vibrio sp. 10N.286.49.B3]